MTVNPIEGTSISGVREMGAQDFMMDNQRRSKFTDREALDLILLKSASGDRGRDPLHLTLQKQWFMNVAMFLGMQAVDTIEALQDIDPTFIPNERGFRANHIFRHVMREVAKLTTSDAVFDVIPQTPDIDDQFGAKVASHFVKHWESVKQLRLLKMDLAFWIAVCGDAFRFTDWDPHAGSEIETYKNPFNDELVDASTYSDDAMQFLRDTKSVKKRFEGDLHEEALSPFQVLIPRGFRHLRNMPWIILEYERSVDWVWDRYPKKAKTMTVEDFDTSADGQYWKRLSSMVNRHGFTLPSRAAEGNETVRVHEMWIPPSGRFPNGGFIRALRRTLLHNGPHPWAAGGVDVRAMPWMRFPIEHYQYCQVPGRFWGMGLVEHLVAAQQDYNTARHQEISMRDAVGTPQWLKHRDTTMTSTRNEHGDIWEYDGTRGKPELQQAPVMSQIHFETKERALSDMRQISAQNEATQGDVPTGVRSGVAIRYLQEKDTQSGTPTYVDFETNWQASTRKQITLTWKFLDIPRSIQVYGEARQADIQIFKGSDIHGNVFLEVQAGSMLPRSKAETAQMLQDLMQSGALDPTNPEDREYLLEGMEIGGIDRFFFLRNLDKRRASIENQMFLRPLMDQQTGQPQPFPDIHDDDDHEVHLREHMTLTKSDAFEVLPPARKLMIEAHMLKHKQALAEMMQSAMAMQAPAMDAGPMGPGGGSPPSPNGEPSQPRETQETPGSTPAPA